LGRNKHKVFGREVVVPDVQFGELPFAFTILIYTQRATTITTKALGFDNIIHNDARTI